MCVCVVYVSVCSIANMWKSEDNMQELVLCFHHADHEDWTQVLSLD